MKATRGQTTEIIVVLGLVTGLTLADLDTILVVDGLLIRDPFTELDCTFVEVNGTTAPGVYLLSFVPDRVGSLFIRIQEGVLVQEYQVEVEESGHIFDAAQEGDYLCTVQAGVTPIADALVRVFSLANVLIMRGHTNSQGKITFPLQTGQYYLRVSKEGVDFTALNPTLITVYPNNNTAPYLKEIIPNIASVGDTLTLEGEYFNPYAEIEFGVEAIVPIFALSTSRKVLSVVVPPLVGTIIPVRVRKPDPDNIGSYLYSGVVTFQRV